MDEGRLPEGGRSRTPAVDAAKTFAAQLAAHGVTVKGEPKKAKGQGEEIARVESLPVHVLMETAMNRSNNSFTEILGLQLARHTGHPSTFAGAVAAIEEQLRPLGLWEKGTKLHDSSGLSRSNRVTPSTLARAAALIDTDRRLSVLLDGFPTAGVTGTLADRFEDDVARPARGVARAKTGTLSFVSTLAGTTVTDDGRLLAFAFMINGVPDGWAAKVWADQATGVVASCGC
ncbi:MAG: D-alanyl-D-alanine carboxypeptidase/D-alanyl-D-alanine-endopeptidase [Arachnia sp.]